MVKTIGMDIIRQIPESFREIIGLGYILDIN